MFHSFFSFLDKVEEVYQNNYVPSDQDILRCRVMTTAIQNIEFNVPDGGNQVRFRYVRVVDLVLNKFEFKNK